jgi:hypothetical protein
MRWCGRRTDARPPLPAALVDRRISSVIDSAGQKLAYVYFEDEPGRRLAGYTGTCLADYGDDYLANGGTMQAKPQDAPAPTGFHGPG